MPASDPAGRCGRIRPMSSASFDYEQVTRVTAGAIGQPGKREFYLQLRAGGQLVSLALEKDQLRALTERLQEVFSRVPVPPAGRLPDMTLEQPVTPMWRGGLYTLPHHEGDKKFEGSLGELVDERDQPGTRHFQASLTHKQALPPPPAPP